MYLEDILISLFYMEVSSSHSVSWIICHCQGICKDPYFWWLRHASELEEYHWYYGLWEDFLSPPEQGQRAAAIHFWQTAQINMIISFSISQCQEPAPILSQAFTFFVRRSSPCDLYEVGKGEVAASRRKSAAFLYLPPSRESSWEI